MFRVVYRLIGNLSKNLTRFFVITHLTSFVAKHEWLNIITYIHICTHIPTCTQMQKINTLKIQQGTAALLLVFLPD